MPILDLNSMRVESKWQNFKQKVKNRTNDAVNWVRNNPELVGSALTVGTVVVGGAVKVGKKLVRTHNIRAERYNKERYIYDRSLGMYLHTKRKLTNKDYATINACKAKGESLSSILMRMKILD